MQHSDHFLRHAGEPHERLIRPNRHLKSGSRPHWIRNDLGSLRKHRLLQGICRPDDTAVLKTLLKVFGDLLVLLQLTTEKLGDDFTCQIIPCWSKAAAADYEIAQSPCLAECPDQLIFIVADL